MEPYFNPQMVVMLGPNGQPLSYYKDRSWDLQSISTDGGQTSYSHTFLDAQPPSDSPEIGRPNLTALIGEQQKALLWLHMDVGWRRALRTILQAGRTTNRFTQGVVSRGTSLSELFCNPQVLSEESAELNSSYANTVRALLRTLWRHRDFFKIGLEIRLRQLVEVIKESAPGEAKDRQTPIIPSRIYCAILPSLLDRLDEIESDLDTLLDVYRQERTCTLGASSCLTNKRRYMQREIQLQGMLEVIRNRGWKTGSMRRFVAGEIAVVQLRLMCIVIAFAGMRVAEAQILSLRGVLEEAKHRDTVHHVVNGYSHKLNGGRKRRAS